MIQQANKNRRFVFLGMFILCSGLYASFAASTERIVRFPDSETQNTLFYINAAAETKWWWPNPVLDESAAVARGNAAVDAQRPLGLIIKTDGTDDPLTVLDALAPDDLHTLIIHGKVNRGDSQVIIDTNIDACTRLSGLKCLILNQVIISERALAKLSAMKSLEKLCIITETLDDDGVKQIAQMKGLKGLRLYGAIGNKSRESVSTMNNLEELFVGGRFLSDQGILYISKMKNLKELVLSHANHTEQGLRHLTAMPSLEKLDLLGFEIGPEAAAYLAAVPHLRSLALNRAITDAAAAQLAQSPSMEDLNLSMHPFHSNRDLTDAGLQSLCQISTLQSLSIYYGRFTDDGLMHLAALPCLQHLMMPNTPIAENTFQYLKNALPYLEDARFSFFVFAADQPDLTWKEYRRTLARPNRKTNVKTKQQDDIEPKGPVRGQEDNRFLPPPGRGALKFDGIDDFLQVQASQTLALEGPFTVQVWIKPEFPEVSIPDKARNLLCKGGFVISAQSDEKLNRQANAYGFAITLTPDENNQMLVDSVTGNGGLYPTTLGMPQSQDWTHLMLKFNSSKYEPAPKSDLLIGSKYLIPFGHFYKGQIGELRIWNRELTREEIQKYKTCAVTGSEPGLVACWTFEDDTGQQIPDITENRNDARLGTTYRAEDSDPTWVRLDETIGQAVGSDI